MTDKTFDHATGQHVASVTATTDGLTTGLIPIGATFVSITAGADANAIVTLPASDVGARITMWIGATGCELRTPAASGATINGVDSDGTNEAAIPASHMLIATCVAADTWILQDTTELGTVGAAGIVPDAA